MVPITAGYRFLFWENRIAATADMGVEIMPWAGLVYSEAGGSGSSGELSQPPDVTVGWLGRIGIAWHIVPSFALTLELTGRYLRTRRLVFHDYPTMQAIGPDGRGVRLNFSGVGCQMGFTAYFF
jgi:hypothetical protein